MLIKIKKIKNGKLPEYKTQGSAGADCYARIEKDIVIPKGKSGTIPLGFAVEIPEGYEMQIRGRSGLASKSEIEGFTGTIDSDYRGEVNAILFNRSDKDFVVKNEDRIAQAIIAPIIKAEWHLTEKLSETERGEGGFGSTGVSEVKMNYSHQIEKFYEPFKTVEDVEPFFQKEVILFANVVAKVYSAEMVSTVVGRQLFITFMDNDYTKRNMSAVGAFEAATIDGHRFGKEMEFE